MRTKNFITGSILLIGLLVWTSCSKENDIVTPPVDTDDEITYLDGSFPEEINLPPSGDNGAYDPSVATDPMTGRVWMSYSRVEGQAGSGYVSTHLAYSDDGGATWNYSGLINQAEEVLPADRPSEFASAVSAHWNHEVSSIVYDPDAPSTERWRLIWHTYLHVDDGIAGNEDRKFIYGWIATRTASDPTLLASDTTKKLFSAMGYHISTDVESYNNSIDGGVPQVKLHELNSILSDVVAFSEPGMVSYNGDLYVSLSAETMTDGKVILIKFDHTSIDWNYLSTLLSPSDAQTLNSNWNRFSASDLFIKGTQAYLLASPVITLYEGSMLFKLNLTAGEVEKSGGIPNVIYTFEKTTDAIQTGVATYDTGLTQTGIIIGDAVWDTPQFRVYSTGVANTV
jgi:hypothetical protein